MAQPLLTKPIFVALDLDDIAQVRKVANDVAPFVGGYKVGPRLCMRYGPALVSELAKLHPVFVDNKYFDIPNTMESAVAATFDAGASLVTVHAQAGGEALCRLSELEAKLNRVRPFRILSVTILTSFSQPQLPPVSRDMPIAKQVEALAELTLESGLRGLVCSSEEVQALRHRHPEAFLVVPGIRMSGDEASDQMRVSDPASAIKAGASALVVGRPIIGAQDPIAAAKRFAEATNI